MGLFRKYVLPTALLLRRRCYTLGWHLKRVHCPVIYVICSYFVSVHISAHAHVRRTGAVGQIYIYKYVRSLDRREDE